MLYYSPCIIHQNAIHIIYNFTCFYDKTVIIKATWHAFCNNNNNWPSEKLKLLKNESPAREQLGKKRIKLKFMIELIQVQ